MKNIKNSNVRASLRRSIVLLVLICTSVGMWGQATSRKKTVPWEMLKNEAINNNKDAQYFIGKIYTAGSDVCFANTPGKLDTIILMNKEQAAYWFRKAAEQGVADAENALGICYAEGEGVVADNKQAIYWFRKAAKQGHSLAQANVGVFYNEGYGIEKDGNNALYWFEKAIENKDKTLEDNVDALKQIIDDLKKAGYSSLRAKID